MGELVFVETAERLGVEELFLAAGDEARVAVHAGDQTTTVTGYGEPRRQQFNIFASIR